MYQQERNTLRSLWAGGLFSKPYYASRLPEGAGHFDSYEAFCRIPLMKKQSLRDTNVWDRTNTTMEDVYGIFSSSGTTGDKTFYIYSKEDKRVYDIFVKTFFTSLGIGENDLGGVMAPVGTGVMAHSMMWQFSTMGAGYVNCPEPSPQNIIDMVAHLPITVIATRPNIVSNIVHDPEMVNIAQNSSVKKLALGGGFLSHTRRALLEDRWGADCYNLFGMSEMFGPMAAECSEKHGLHYLNEYLLIELLDPVTAEPVKQGETGVAVYTTLWNKGFPLLRYWTDDLMYIDETPCPCGETTSRLFYCGRLADQFLIEGRYVFPEQVENILFSYGLIGDYRVVREGDTYTVFSECPHQVDCTPIVAELSALFCNAITMELCPPRSLGYQGFGNRFVTK